MTHPPDYYGGPGPGAVERIAQRQREHDEWLGNMAAHFDKMVAASMNNRHPDEKRELMRDFITGLESHFNDKYRRG